MALAAFRIWLREGDDWATHASYHRIVLEIRFRSWLGRKDSNLQPSDPESAALPLRHSPNAAQRAGRIILRTARRGAGYSLPPPWERAFIRIDRDSRVPLLFPKSSSNSAFAL